MTYDSYEDFYDNGPGSEAFKRECAKTQRASTPFVLKSDVAEMEAELDYLRYFKQHADFGPADGDVHQAIDLMYEESTGKRVPKDWRYDDE